LGREPKNLPGKVRWDKLSGAEGHRRIDNRKMGHASGTG